jgi:DNA mismatch repair protein MutS2
MDEHTLRVLDFERIREILEDLAQTDLGRSALRTLEPGGERAAIEHELDLVGELASSGEEPPLGLVSDIRPLLEPGRADAVLSPQELLTVRSTLDGLGRVHEYLGKRKAKLPLVAREVAGIRGFDHLKAEIEHVVSETGEIRDDASPELKRIRTRLRRLRNEIVRSLEAIAAASPDLFQDRTCSIRGGRFVLPLRAEARNRFDAVLHDTSDSGHTLFVEPLQLLPDQNELARLRSAEQDEVQRILRTISMALRAEAPALAAALEGVTRLDVIGAKRRFAVRFDAVRPIISQRDSVQIIGARHPLLQAKKQAIVPLTFVLPDDARVVLISGPNAGGKTVAMKTLGLFALMLSTGMYLPAGAGTELPLFSRIFADIGDEQSLESDLSSFSAHLLRTRRILEQADRDSLVLLDEIGGSTSPEEGSALAIAVLEQLQARGAVAIATSHLGPLKAFVQDAQGMANAAMEFKGRPTYRLLMGVPGESSALEIAAGLGFPADVLNQARKYMNEDVLKFSERLKELTAERDAAERLRAELSREKEQTTELRREWNQKTAALREFEAAERKRFRLEQETVLKQTRREIENLVRQIREQQASHEAIKAAKTYVVQKLASSGTTGRENRSEPPAPSPEPDTRSGGAAATPTPEPIAVGDYVSSGLFAKDGVVLDIEDGRATVAFGSIKMKLETSDLRLVRRPAPEPQPEALVSAEEFDPRLNLRGMTQEQARETLDRFLDRAEMNGARQVSVLHGKGTGALRTMLWERLKHDRRVAEFRLGEPNEGGSGITFVTLKA